MRRIQKKNTISVIMGLSTINLVLMKVQLRNTMFEPLNLETCMVCGFKESEI
jgi:hypothetical protein